MTPVTLYLVDSCLLSRISNNIYFSKNKSYQYKIFDNATDCIKDLKEGNSLIISDIDLPDINGIEQAKIVKSKHPETKILIYTSREDATSVLASLSNGVSAYILKRKRRNLKNIIEKILKNEFYMDLRTATSTFSKIPSSNIEDMEQIKESRKLKYNLTTRELEVLKLIIDGKTNTQIADEIIISANTAKAHVGSILTKLSVTDRVQAAVKAVKANIV